MEKLSKAQLIRALEKAEKCPRDLGGRIGEFGVVGLSGAGSAALVSTLMATTATTTVTAPVLGSTFLGGLVGATATVTTVVAAPVWAVAAGAVGGVLATQGILRFVRSGARNDKIREDYICALRQKIEGFEESMPGTATTATDFELAKLAGVYAALLKLDAVSTEEVVSLFNGPVLQAERISTAHENARRILASLDDHQERQ